MACPEIWEFALPVRNDLIIVKFQQLAKLAHGHCFVNAGPLLESLYFLLSWLNEQK